MIVLVLLLAVASEAGQDAQYQRFLQEFDSGVDCPRLFVLRNEAKRGSSDARQEEMNTKLRSVGCFNATSKRRPTSPPGTGGFTVKEYRIYRAVLDTPMSISDADSLRAVGKRYGVTPAVAKRATRKVQEVLFKNDWMATPEAEIRHASDWSGEKQ